MHTVFSNFFFIEINYSLFIMYCNNVVIECCVKLENIVYTFSPGGILIKICIYFILNP